MNLHTDYPDEFYYEYDDYLPVYKNPEDCFFEIVNNMFNSKKVDDYNLLDDMRWICKHYDVCRDIYNEIDFSRNNYLDKGYPVNGIIERTEFKDLRSAIGELAYRLYFAPRIFTDKDMRPIVAYILDQYKMPTDLVDDISHVA